MTTYKTSLTFIAFIAINSLLFHIILLLPDFLADKTLLFSFNFESKKMVLIQLLTNSFFYFALLGPLAFILFNLFKPFSAKIFILATATINVLLSCTLLTLYLATR